MAVIQKLRNSGAVVVVIIVALVLFVVGDIVTGNKMTGIGRDEADVAGEVFGEKIRERDIDPLVRDLAKQQSEQNPNFKFDENTRKQLIEQAWTTLIRQRTYEAQIAKSGINITDEDFNEMTVGQHPIESIKGDPSFQTDNKFDPRKVIEIFRQAKSDPSLRGRVAAYVKQLKDQEREKRYTTYISKAQMKSKTEKEYEYVASNQGASGKIVAVNYSTVLDKDIKVTDSDLEKYLKEHKEEYKQTVSSRDISYVVWDLVPSAEDTAYSKKQAEEVYLRWSKETKPDTAGEDVVAFKAVRDITLDSAKMAMYSGLSTLPKNGMLPILTIEGKYHIVQKLDEMKDTANPFVKVSHILIPMNGELPNKTAVKDSAQALQIANELLAKINAGADLGALAKDYSGDPGSANNKGVYDWKAANTYVPSFAQFCATHNAGETGVVKTQYGYHVMKMLANPDFMKVKYRERSIEVVAGSETIKLVDEASSKFYNAAITGGQKTFEATRDKLGLKPLVKKDIKTEDRTLGGISTPEDVKTILSWLFDKERKTNDMSSVFPFSSRHVVVFVNSVKNRGYATVADVREKIEPLVRNELKAEKIREKIEKAMASAKTAEDIAAKVGGTVVPVEGLKMGSNFIPQLFTEPRILGAIFGVKEKSWSKPVSGNNVVAIVWVDKKDKVEIPKTGIDEGPDFANNPQFLANRLQDVLKNKGELQDYRYKFSWD